MKTGTIHPAGGTRLPLPTCPPCTLPPRLSGPLPWCRSARAQVTIILLHNGPKAQEQ